MQLSSSNSIQPACVVQSAQTHQDVSLFKQHVPIARPVEMNNLLKTQNVQQEIITPLNRTLTNHVAQESPNGVGLTIN